MGSRLKNTTRREGGVDNTRQTELTTGGLISRQEMWMEMEESRSVHKARNDEMIPAGSRSAN